MRLKTAFPGGLCGAKTQAGHPCRSLKVRLCKNGNLRCKWHGYYATGAKTPEGKAKAALNIRGIQSGGPRRPEAIARVTLNLRNTPTWQKKREREALGTTILTAHPVEKALESVTAARDPETFLAARRALNKALLRADQARKRSLASKKAAATRKANQAKQKEFAERMERARQRITVESNK